MLMSVSSVASKNLQCILCRANCTRLRFCIHEISVCLTANECLSQMRRNGYDHEASDFTSIPKVNLRSDGMDYGRLSEQKIKIE